MAGKIWTAEELDRLTPAEQDAIFQSSLVTDPADVPAEYLAHVRARLEDRIAKRNPPNRS